MRVELRCSKGELDGLIAKAKNSSRRQRLRVIRWALEGLTVEGEVLVKKLSASTDLADIVGKTPKEIFDRARAKGRGSKGGGALGVLMQDVLIQGDYVHLMMNGAGKATITAKYQDGGVTKEGSITVTVEPVQFEINPANATYEVGEEATFYAAIKNAKSRNLPNGVSQWSAKPEGIVSIAPIQPDPTSMFLTRMVW